MAASEKGYMEIEHNSIFNSESDVEMGDFNIVMDSDDDELFKLSVLIESENPQNPQPCVSTRRSPVESDSDIDKTSGSETGQLDIRRRFPVIGETEMSEIENDATSKGTKKQTKWEVDLFRQWLNEVGDDSNFEGMSEEKLDDCLRRFYGAARNANGALYSKSTLVGIRASINRHLRAPPYSKPLSIMDDGAFHKSNIMFKSMLKKLKREGCDRTQHHQPISHGDLVKLQSSGQLSTESPRTLQQKVWFDLTLGFARRGCENLRNLRASSFLLKKDDVGKEYIQMAYNEATKNHPGDNMKDGDFESKTRMYATGDEFCPVRSFQKYLDKRDQGNDILFQQAKVKVSADDETWYTSRPVGEKTLNTIMKRMSIAAQLSQTYTNHCVRASTVTMLAHAGVEVREIMRISGHRNEQSIRSYNNDSSDQQKRYYSSILHGAAAGSESQLASAGSTPNPGVLSPAAIPSMSYATPRICSAAPELAFQMAAVSSPRPILDTPRTPLFPLPITLHNNNNTNINNEVVFPGTQYPKQFEVHNSTVKVYNYFGH